MEDFFAAGGMGALLRELQAAAASRLHDRDRRDAGRAARRPSRRLRRPHASSRARDTPIEPQGGLVALFGNLAPEGAILKRSAADAKLFEHEGRAVVFASLEDLAARIDDPDARRDGRRHPGAAERRPACARGMPEAGYLPIPKKLAQRRASRTWCASRDARMSGTAFGTIVLHVDARGGVGRAAGAGAQRRPHPAVGQGAAHRSAGRRGRAEAARGGGEARRGEADARLCQALCARKSWAPTRAAISHSCGRNEQSRSKKGRSNGEGRSHPIFRVGGAAASGALVYDDSIKTQRRRS